MAAEHDYSRSTAILVGVGEFDDSEFLPLPAALNSLAGMHRILTNPNLSGWPADKERVVVLRNPQHAGRVARYLRQLARETQDVLIVYWVGHGNISIEGNLCLAVQDTAADAPDLTGVDYDWVKRALLESPARVKITILDCCYAGRAIEAQMTNGTTIADVTDVFGTYTLTATTRNKPAHVVQLEQQNGAYTSFTGQLLDIVESGIPDGPLDLTFEHIYPRLQRRLASLGLPRPNQRGIGTGNKYPFSRNIAVPSSTANLTVQRWQVLSHSQTGEAYRQRGIACQDASSCGHLETGNWIYLIVSDGHGSAEHFRSDRGAKFAVAALRETFKEFMRLLLDEELSLNGTTRIDIGEGKTFWRTIVPKRTVARWRSLVYQDLLQNPPLLSNGENGLYRFLDRTRERQGHVGLKEVYTQLGNFYDYAISSLGRISIETPLPLSSEDDWDANKLGSWQAKAYGATLLGVLIGPDALYWLQIGDGAMVKVTETGARYLVPPPDDALANDTPSLSADTAVHSINLGAESLETNSPSAMMLATDGVRNSFTELEGFFNFCAGVAKRAEGNSSIKADLPRWLSEISKKGSGDHVSLALAWLNSFSRPDGHQDVPSMRGDRGGA